MGSVTSSCRARPAATAPGRCLWRSHSLPAMMTSHLIKAWSSHPTGAYGGYEPDGIWGGTRGGACAPVPLASMLLRSAQRAEPRAHFLGEQLGLFPRREVAAFGDLIVVD